MKYTFISTRPFPIDMLRYDACFPATEESSNEIILSLHENTGAIVFRVTLEFRRVPTFVRWQSFGWKELKSGTYAC